MKAKAINVETDEYVLGRTSAEYQRLREQAAALEPATRRVLQQVELRAGMSCLDVGCGPGEVMRLMGETVGHSGQVTGLDCDSKLGHEAVAVLNATAQSQFRFVAGDIEVIDDVAGAPFDVTFARLVLIHVRDPLATLRKMYALTKPGGYVVVQDYDMRTVDMYPKLALWTELERVIFGVIASAGKDARIGHKLPAYFVQAGLGVPDGTDVSGLLLSLQQASPMFLAVYRTLLPKALALGITTEAASAAFLLDMERAAVGEQYYASFWPLLIGVWRRKPE